MKVSRSLSRVLAVSGLAVATVLTLAAPAAAARTIVTCGGETQADATLANSIRASMNGDRMGQAVNGYRISCARAIVHETRRRGLNQRASVIAVTTAITESVLENRSDMADHDSLGLFQQRPSQGWGTPAQILNPAYATGRFLEKMLRVYPNNSWQNADIGTVCQNVQISGVPDAYGRQVHDATIVVNAVWALADPDRPLPPGQNPTPAPAAVVFPESEGAPAIGRHVDGRLELFPVTRDGGVENVFETSPNGPWSGPSGFGPPLAVRETVAVNHKSGRMEVFAVGADNSIWNRFESAPNGPWSGWSNFAPAGSASSVLAARHHNSNRLEIFAVKPDGSVWNRFESTPDGPWSDWNVFAHAGSRIRSATVAAHQDNRLEVFAVTADGAVLNKYQTTPDGAWSDWDSFAPAGSAAYLKTARHGSGRLEVFAVKPDGAIINKFESTPNAPWSGWNGFADPGTASISRTALAVATHAGGRLELFAVRPDGAVTNRFESTPDGPWSGWNGFADPGHAVTVNATRHADNRLEVFTTAPDGGVDNRFETAPNAVWSGWNPYLPAG